MRIQHGRFSVFIRPITYLFDLLVINVLINIVLPKDYNILYFHLFVTLCWFVIALNVKFYEVYRFTKPLAILQKLFKQFFFFLILCYSFSGFYFNNVKSFRIANYVLFSFLCVSFFKFLVYFLLRKYRLYFGGNMRNIIIIGSIGKTQPLYHFFKDNLDYGYRVLASFQPNNVEQLEQAFAKIKENKIKTDEIYIPFSDFSDKQKALIIDFADNSLISLKFIADDEDIISGKYKYDYYGYIPIISSREIPLDDNINKIIKRLFDLVFSILVMIFVLSWLIPLMSLLIKRESKGPTFFRQKRNGLNYKEFNCIKFRSMRVNEIADKQQVSKNDPRITKIGAFMRKTSIDELPQFINVFFGDMSVVGPRPHMVSETERFASKVDKFMVRHLIKPGITGLAQTSGYRGEVETEKDIIYRVKYDIYYIENWSVFLDFKIIFLTIYNAVKGEEKAY